MTLFNAFVVILQKVFRPVIIKDEVIVLNSVRSQKGAVVVNFQTRFLISISSRVTLSSQASRFMKGHSLPIELSTRHS